MAEPPHDEYEDDFEDDDEVAEGQAEPGGDAVDGEVAEEDEEDEDEKEEDDAQPWTGLNRLPEKEELLSLLQELRDAGRKQLTILLLGKSSVGKSSLVNSLLGDAVMRVQAFKLQADAEITHTVVRQVAAEGHEADGFRIKLIDTCGLEDPEAGDTVNWGALSKIAEDIRGVPIDVVLYVDRLDLYRVDPLDKAIIGAISQTFGRQIWRRTIIALTHANMPQTPPGTDYDAFANGRIRLIRGAIRGPLPLLRPSLPAALVENSNTCPVNDKRHRVLPDGTEWLVALATELADMALLRPRPYKYHPRMTSKPSQRFRWLLPLVVVAEVLLYQKVLQPALRRNQEVVKEGEERVWSLRRQQRGALGLHPPNRPTDEATWRLEQMYDDD